MRANPEKLAWRVLLAAFAIFLLLCGTTIYGVYWFIFLSYAPMDVTLEASRGTVQIMLPASEEPIAVTDHRPGIEAEAVIQTDSISQGIMTFADRRTGEPVASLTLFTDSEVELIGARSPRFSLNHSPYVIQVASQMGHTDILVLEPTDERSVTFGLTTPQIIARLFGPGLYAANVAQLETSFTTRDGLAFIKGHTVNSPVAQVESNERITIEADEEPLEAPETVESLLTNNLFHDDLEEGWSFYNDREPPGQAFRVVFDGRDVVAIDRSQERFPGEQLGHAETGLVQFLNMDVSAYDYLEMRVVFYVAEQSLSACGIAGSECPMMIRMVYEDARGTERVYIHGFYTDHDPGRGYPLACDTCRTEHERVALNTWHTFESGNLMTLLPNGLQPEYIHQVSFYASGHAYLTYVSEISLMAEE